MKNFLRLGVALSLAGAVVALPGCGGGGGNSIPVDVSQYAGTYNGTFSGVVSQGFPYAGQTVTGTFSAIADSAGNVTGTFTQADIGTQSASGRVSAGGKIFVTAPYNGTTATLTGSITGNAGILSASGSFTTTQGPAVIIRGSFSGATVVPN